MRDRHHQALLDYLETLRTAANSPSHTDIAKAIGFRRTQVHDTLQGLYLPRPTTLQPIVEHLGGDTAHARALLEPARETALHRHRAALRTARDNRLVGEARANHAAALRTRYEAGATLRELAQDGHSVWATRKLVLEAGATLRTARRVKPVDVTLARKLRRRYETGRSIRDIAEELRQAGTPLSYGSVRHLLLAARTTMRATGGVPPVVVDSGDDAT